MGDHAYTRKVTEACKLLKIQSSKIKHIGRNTAPAIMDMAEVDRVDQKNIGNWSNEVLTNVYSTKLSLGAIRALIGVDKRRGYYKNPMTTFKGDITRKHKKSHFVIIHMSEIFESAAFIDYSHKLSAHMAEKNNKNDVMGDNILLGVLGKLYDQPKATNEIITEVTKEAAEIRVLKGEIKTVVTDPIKNVTNHVRNYGEDDEAMDVVIDQELVLALS